MKKDESHELHKIVVNVRKKCGHQFSFQDCIRCETILKNKLKKSASRFIRDFGDQMKELADE